MHLKLKKNMHALLLILVELYNRPQNRQTEQSKQKKYINERKIS